MKIPPAKLQDIWARMYIAALENPPPCATKDWNGESMRGYATKCANHGIKELKNLDSD